MVKGRIKQSLSGYYDVLVDDKIYRTRARGNFRKKKLTPLVGDWVEFKFEDNSTDGYVLKIYERKNELVRPPVANIDSAIVVSACVEPKFSTNLLDRQIAMLESHDIEPVLYFSKADILSESEYNEINEYVSYYKEFYPTYITRNQEHKKDILDQMMDTLKNKVVVVMGQTGAGKSTMLNEIDKSLQIETGEISKALSRGKHTTRKVTLHDINDVLIADTPGFSSFDLLEITKEELPLLFRDFVKYQDGCKFRGCLHINEPKCAVKDAVLAGDILKSRYENYLQFNEMIVNKKIKYR